MRPLQPDSSASVQEKEAWIAALLEPQTCDYNAPLDRSLTSDLLSHELGRDRADFLVDLHWRAWLREPLLPLERELLKGPSGSTGRHQKTQADKREAAFHARAEVNKAKGAVQAATEDLNWQRGHLAKAEFVQRLDFDTYMAAQRSVARHSDFGMAMEFVRDASVARETLKFVSEVIVPEAERRKLEAENALSALLKDAA